MKHLGKFLTLIVAASLGWSTLACTIFVLVDRERALFFNNEDYSNPNTRVWFIPPGTNYLGCVYVGFDDGCGQGGMNSAGLAFDWVAGFNDRYEPARKLKRARGFSSMRMLETCRTVDEAIRFYETHREVEFRRARIMVADQSGASAIIGARDGKLLVERETHCRGFGYGREVLKKMLATDTPATFDKGAEILRAAKQEGEFATKYSNVFDLKNGDIFFLPSGQTNAPIKLNLAAEFARGPHYYDIPELKTQLTEAPLPLLNNLKRFYFDEFTAIPDPNPSLTRHLTKTMRDAATGKLHEADYAPGLWKELSAQAATVRADLAKLGKFKSLTLVQNAPGDSPETHRYKMQFTKATVLQMFTLDPSGVITASQSDAVEFTENPD